MAELTLLTKAERAVRIAEIRNLALSEIQSKAGGINSATLLHELQALKQKPLSTEWLEASILVYVIGRMRPSRTVNFLNRVRGRMAKAGKSAAFDEFEDQIKSYLAPEVLTNHGYHANTFDQIEHKDIWAKVSDHLAALKSEGYDVFLNSGTLLGIVRDKKLIDHDDDIDLAVILRASDAKSAAVEWRQLGDTLWDLGLLEKKTPNMLGIYKLRPAGSIEIDLFPAWIQNDQVYVYPHTFGELPASDLLPLQLCPLTGHTLPAAPEKMLAQNYGDNWIKPDAFFKFPWSDAKRKFATFLESVQE
ncbi:MAG: LicD family protein [Sulfitobacter sp.]